MSWYRFWKKVRGRKIDEYMFFDHHFNDDEEQEKVMRDECLDWANKMPGGHNTGTGYRYGFEKKNPSKRRAKKMVADFTKKIKYCQEKIDRLKIFIPNKKPKEK